MNTDRFARWLGVAGCLLAGVACAQEPKATLTDAKDGTPSDFARFVAEGDGGHFDTAITTYRNADGVTVRLFAAVHIADGALYRELERRFATCDKLLYELVGPENYRPKKGEPRDGFVSMLQQALKNGLELEFQLDGIDYSAANFVHADMTRREFEESMQERGENLFLMLWKVGMNAQAGMTQAQAGKAQVPVTSLVTAFRNGEGRHQMRLMMAQQLEQLEAATTGDAGSTLLEGRNEKCLEVLRAQIRDGQRNLGIYYGAAHLPHMERRLTEDMGFEKVDHEWVVAWDCSKRPDPKVDRELWRQRRKAKDEVARLERSVQRWLDDHAERVPTMAQLQQTDADGRAYWQGSTRDPWGNDYAITGYRRAPHFDVHCLGQDGIADSDDDIHCSTPRELRRMQRGETGDK